MWPPRPPPPPPTTILRPHHIPTRTSHHDHDVPPPPPSRPRSPPPPDRASDHNHSPDHGAGHHDHDRELPAASHDHNCGYDVTHYSTSVDNDDHNCGYDHDSADDNHSADDGPLHHPHPATTWWHPGPLTSWAYVIGENYPLQVPPIVNGVPTPVQAVDADLGDESGLTSTGVPVVNPTIVSSVDAIHAMGGKAICYVDAGGAENYRSDYGKFDPSELGSAQPGWPNEKFIDVNDWSTSVPAGYETLHSSAVMWRPTNPAEPLTSALIATPSTWQGQPGTVPSCTGQR